MNTKRAELLTLLLDPERINEVAPDAIPALIGEAAALQAQLWARLQSANTAPAAAPVQASTSGDDELLTVKQAAARLGVSRKWLYRHAPSLPFTRKLSTGTLRFSARGLERWKESRARRAA